MLSHSEELKDRVQAKRHEIESKIAKLKADTRSNARDEITSLEFRLREVQDMVAQGWERLSENTIHKINDWLKN